MADTDSRKFGWTLETAMAHIESLSLERDRRYEQRFSSIESAASESNRLIRNEVSTALAASEKAVLKAESATEKRFESVNEFRQTLADQTASLIPRVEVDQRFGAINEKYDDLKGSKSDGSKMAWGNVATLAFLAVAIIEAVILFSRH